MPIESLEILLAAVTVGSGAALFLQKRLMRSVIFLALAAVGSSLIFIYIGQTLVALLQLLVFVGGLSTYLIVAVAAEEKQVKMRNVFVFAASAIVLAVGFVAALSGLGPTQVSGNAFSGAAQNAFSEYYAVLFASVFLLFAVAVGSVAVIKKFAKLVV
ncbi:MAG: NADH-quinone oxidoreductase subunit J [Candidatus Micrarchaeota archaeon]|nr:NADH-quinone oxidoreductase subunit J [Candidatus Micrarchaeota archaeon]